MFDLLKMLLAPLIWNWNKYRYFPLKITLNFIYICKCIYKKLFWWDFHEFDFMLSQLKWMHFSEQ